MVGVRDRGVLFSCGDKRATMTMWQPAVREGAPRLESRSSRLAATAVSAVLAALTIAWLVQHFEAPIALAVPLFLLAAAILLVRPDLATVVTVFLLYVNFPAILTKQHGLPPVVAGSFILLLGFPILHALIIRRESLKADRTFYVMLAFLGAYLLSTLKAVDRTVAFTFILTYVLEGLVLYWLVINVIRSLPTLRRVIWTVLAAGAFLSGLSLYQTVTGSYDQEFGGLAYRTYKARPAPDADVDVAEPARQRPRSMRAQGPVAQPNRFAQTLVVLVPLAVGMYRTGRSSRARMWAAGLGLMVVTGIALTLSRGSFLCLVVITGIMMALKWIRYSRVLVAVLLFVVIAPSVPFFLHRITALAHTASVIGDERASGAKGADGAVLGRATLMMSALRVFMDHPVIGVGAGQFPRFYSQAYSRDVNFRDLREGNWRAHSLYLEIAAEVGAVGLSLFLLAVGVIVHGLWRARQYFATRDSARADLATAFWLSLVAYLITGIIQHLSFQRYYWFLLALAGAALHTLYLQSTEEAVATDSAVVRRHVPT